jgi:hypothetical protein
MAPIPLVIKVLAPLSVIGGVGRPVEALSRRRENPRPHAFFTHARRHTKGA